jgi:CHASE2 domain-containing sensor protein
MIKQLIFKGSIIDFFSVLSLVLFFITTDHFVAPLGLLFLLSIVHQVALLEVIFGLALLLFCLALLVKQKKQKCVLKIGYIVLAVCCIGAISLGNLSMLSETPTLFSFVVFLFFISIMIWKYRLVAMQYVREKRTGTRA